MRILFCLAAITLACACTPEKKSDASSADTLKIDTISAPENQTATTSSEIKEEPEPVFEVVSVVNNDWLGEFIRDPFARVGLDSMVALLKSKSIAMEYNNGENGNLIFEKSEITFNRSYGDAICTADIRSTSLPLSNGIILGMNKSDFLKKVNLTSSSTSQSNKQYEYSNVIGEHTHKVKFYFVDDVLMRFYYEKDPCVIYD